MHASSLLHGAVLDSMAVLGIIGMLFLVVGLALEKWCRSAVERRGLWRCAIIFMILTICLELSGLGRLVATIGLVQPSATSKQISPSLLQQVDSRPVAKPEISSSPSRDYVSSGGLTHGLSIGLLAGLIWIGGSALLAVTLIIRQLLIHHVQTHLQPIIDNDLTRRIHKLADLLGLRHTFRVGIRNGIVSPFVVGVIKPTLILPRAFPVSLGKQHQEAVLLHELAHLVDRDPCWLFLADILCAMVWWHPMSWLLRSHWRLASESAADEAVFRLHEGPLLLAEGLLACHQERQSRWQLGLSIFSPSRSMLCKRIKHLLVEIHHPSSVAWRLILLWVRTSLFASSIMMVMIGAGSVRLHSIWEEEPMFGKNVLRHSLLGLALLASSERPISAQNEGAVLHSANASKSISAAGKSEEGAIQAMGLNQKETGQFQELLVAREDKTAAFRKMKEGPDRSAAGKAIGVWYRETMQTIFTPEQYSKYLEYWEFNNVVIKHGAKRGQGDYQVVVTVHPFDRDNELIKAVKPTKELAAKLTAMQGEYTKKYTQLNQLLKTPEGLSEFDSMVAQMQKQRNDQLKKVLTAEQYQQYRKALNAMIEASWNRTTAARAAAGSGGFAAPIK